MEDLSASSNQAVETDFKVSVEDFDMLNIVGTGTYGRVFKVRKNKGIDKDKVYAMKVLYKKDAIKSTRRTLSAVTERDILTSVNHPFIVKTMYTFHSQTKIYFTMEFLNGGDLFELLSREHSLAEEEASFYVKEIVLALEYLHAMNILYRDLKPENVLIARSGHVKLADFGLSKTNYVEGSRSNSLCGTLDYSAPEVLNKSGHGKEAEWWSLGILFFEMITGGCPFYHKDPRVLTAKILSGKFLMRRYITRNAQDLIRNLLKMNPDSRLGAKGVSEIKEHRFFRGTNWTNVLQGLDMPPYVPKVTSDEDDSMFQKKYTTEPIRQSGERYHISPKDDESFKDFDYVNPLIEDSNSNTN